MQIKKSLLLFIGLILVIGGLSACGGNAGADSEVLTETTEIPPVIAEDTLILAEGRVVPHQKANLGFTASGVVEAVYFNEGDEVKEGEIIASLRGKAQAEAAVAAAELAYLDAQFAYDTVVEQELLSRAEAHQALVDAQQALDDAEDDRESKDYSRASQEILDEARANLVVAEDYVTQKERLYDAVDSRSEQDPIRAEAFAQLASAKKERNRQQANLNWLLGLPDELEMAEADAALEFAQAQVDIAEKAWEDVKNGIDPDTLALAEASLKNAEAQLDAAHAALDDMNLKAPFDGTIVSNDLIIGELVSPTSPAVVIGEFSAWMVESTDLTELDIIKVKVGDEVTVTFDALPGVEHSGSVEKVRTYGENIRGDVTYKVVVSLEDNDEDLLWNMTALIEFIQ